MSTTNVTDAVEPLLKQWYTSAYEDMTYRDHPLMGLVRKEEGGGKVISIKLKYGQNAGRSASFTQAQTNEAALSRTEFLVYPGVDYSLAKVQNTDIELANSDRGAVIRLITDETETAQRNLSDSLERDLFGSGYGTLGKIKAISSATVTLGNVAAPIATMPQQAVNFYPGQKVVFAATEAASSLDNSGAVGTVLSVDLDAGTVTFTDTIANIGNAIATGHFMFQQGDKTNATRLKITGLRGWLPTTAPDSTAFFNVDRSVSPSLLGGWRIDATQLKLVEAINKLSTHIGTLAGARPDTCIMAPSTFEKFVNEISGGSMPAFVERKGRGVDVGYQSISWMSTRGPISVMSSPFCDADRFYVLTTSSWTLWSPGNEPIQTANRNKFVDVYNADAVEVRLRTLAFFGCNAPGYNGVASITPTS